MTQQNILKFRGEIFYFIYNCIGFFRFQSYCVESSLI